MKASPFYDVAFSTLPYNCPAAGEISLSIYNRMVQFVRENRLGSMANVYIVAIIAGSLLLLVPSIRAAIFSIVLCISVVVGVTYMARGGSLGAQVFALLVIVVVFLLTFSVNIAPHPEFHLVRVMEKVPYLAGVAILIVAFQACFRFRQQAYPLPVQPGQLQIADRQ